jgi:prepilin-type N-terminal cleavage/methylation domain-containing protein
MAASRPRVSALRKVTRARFRRSGVTLIELIVAMTILLVGLMGALGFMSIALVSSLNANKLLLARNVAEETMNQIFIMREMNAIGGIPGVQNRNASTFLALFNGSGNSCNAGAQAIFPTTFQPIYTEIGPDLIRGTSDDGRPNCGALNPAVDPRLAEFTIRVLIRDAAVDCLDNEFSNADPLSCPEGDNNAQVKRVIVQVRYPYTNLKGSALRTIRIETFMTVPPSQFQV